MYMHGVRCVLTDGLCSSARECVCVHATTVRPNINYKGHHLEIVYVTYFHISHISKTLRGLNG